MTSRRMTHRTLVDCHFPVQGSTMMLVPEGTEVRVSGWLDYGEVRICSRLEGEPEYLEPARSVGMCHTDSDPFRILHIPEEALEELP